MNLLLIAVFCFVNAKLLKIKDRKPVGMIFATIGICFLLNFVSTMILMLIRFPIESFASQVVEGSTSMTDVYEEIIQTAASDPLFIYIPYVATVLGGFISLLITRAIKPGIGRNYFENMSQGNPAGSENPWQNGSPNGGNPWQSGSPNGGNFWQNGSSDNGGFWQNNTSNNSGSRQSGSAWNNMNSQNGNNMGGFGSAYGTYNDIPMGRSLDEGINSGNMISLPCTICVIRDPSASKTDEIYTISLNGHPACRLGNNTYANIMTNEKQNTVTARDGSGMSLKKPITFLAMDGGFVEIHIKGDSFLPDKTVGKRPAEKNSDRK